MTGGVSGGAVHRAVRRRKLLQSESRRRGGRRRWTRRSDSSRTSSDRYGRNRSWISRSGNDSSSASSSRGRSNVDDRRKRGNKSSRNKQPGNPDLRSGLWRLVVVDDLPYADTDKSTVVSETACWAVRAYTLNPSRGEARFFDRWFYPFYIYSVISGLGCSNCLPSLVLGL